MNRHDFDEAIKQVDKDIVSEAKVRKSRKGLFIGIGTSAACILVACAVLMTYLLSGSFNNSIKQNSEPLLIDYNDGLIGERKNSSGYLDGSMPKSESEYMPVPAPGMEAGYAEYGYDYEKSIDSGYSPVSGEILPGAGTLTAGEWRDTENLADWFKLIRDNNWYAYAEDRNLFTGKAVTVSVTDGKAPCFNVKVELKDGQKVISAGKTDINGKVCLFYNIAKDEKYTPSKVTVNGKDYDVTSDTVEISAKDCGVKLKEIDLMYMIDTTGSMGDELEYIKAELVDMVERIASKDEAVSIRISVNFYRDEGDDYVVKYFDFRNDVNDIMALIKDETANGGGDMPEAVHTALDNVVSGHQWRTNALKLCFFVLDAPPHDETEIQGINAKIRTSLVKAAEEGIRIIPVFCSGADQASEYLFRSFAAITNGTFVFLTNDSGVGNPHLDTSVGEYNVEKLNDCMVRIVCEFAGLEYKAPAYNQQ